MTLHVYFDLDGTLTDPFDGITRCFLYALDRLGVAHPPPEQLPALIGPPLYDTFPPFVGEDRTLQAVDLYRQRFNEVGWLENVPYEGIHDALEAVANTGSPMFVATSKPREAAARIVEHFGLGQYFERVFGCELDGTRANKAELLRYAIDENPPADARVMIGDREHDLRGALANDITPIGVSWGYGSVEELSTAGAVAIAASPAELAGIVSRQLR